MRQPSAAKTWTFKQRSNKTTRGICVKFWLCGDILVLKFLERNFSSNSNLYNWDQSCPWLATVSHQLRLHERLHLVTFPIRFPRPSDIVVSLKDVYCNSFTHGSWCLSPRPPRQLLAPWVRGSDCAGDGDRAREAYTLVHSTQLKPFWWLLQNTHPLLFQYTQPSNPLQPSSIIHPGPVNCCLCGINS